MKYGIGRVSFDRKKGKNYNSVTHSTTLMTKSRLGASAVVHRTPYFLHVGRSERDYLRLVC